MNLGFKIKPKFKIKLKFNLFIIILLGVMASAFVLAADKKKENVLDFEADVIEGDRKRPDLFLEVKGQDLDIESLLYLRKNFNDFYETSKPTNYHFIKKK